MPLQRFNIASDGSLVADQGNLDAASFATDNFDWLDLESEDPERIREILADVGVEARIIEECLHRHRYSRFLNIRSSVFFEFPIICEADDWVHDYVSFVWTTRCLITVRHRHIPALDDPIHYQTRLVAPQKAALLHQLLEAIMKDNIAIALRIREQIDDLSAQADDPTAAIDAGVILTLKRRLFRYMSIFDDQMNCLAFLRQADSPDFDLTHVREYFRDLLKSMEHILRLMNRLERRLEYVQQHCILMLQEKTNSRMKILTVVSAIFLPLTLIAGIYGMNFEIMPELDYRFAYPVTLGAMSGIAVCLLFFFYWRGWFS